MTHPETEASAPVTVNHSIAPDATWQTLRVVLLFGFGALFSHFIDSETVVAAGVVAVGAVLTYGYGLWKLWRTHGAMKFLAGLVSDDVAKVKE